MLRLRLHEREAESVLHPASWLYVELHVLCRSPLYTTDLQLQVLGRIFLRLRSGRKPPHLKSICTTHSTQHPRRSLFPPLLLTSVWMYRREPVMVQVTNFLSENSGGRKPGSLLGLIWRHRGKSNIE